MNDPVVIVGAARTPIGGFGSGRANALNIRRADVSLHRNRPHLLLNEGNNDE